jgi:phage terminase large subunit
MIIDLKYNKVYDETAKAFADGKDTVIHMGGTGSGKTFELVIYLLFYYAKFNANKIVTVVSESLPHLKIGAIRYTDELLIKTQLITQVKHNKSDHTYTFPNGTIIEFFSTDRIGKAIGARRDLLYGNEVNNLKYEVWGELARRSKHILADFNPTSKFWLEDWIQDYSNSIIVKSNYLDNPFLPDHEKERIERRAARDHNFRRVHIDCEYGVYEGLVFEDFTQVDELPKGKTYHGLDFGYTNDPTALVKVVETDEGWYVDEMLYQTGMLSREIAARMRNIDNQQVKADSADPRLIDELKLAGLNVRPAEKGPDSIMAGIDKIKTKKLYVTKRSVNLIRELRNYAWEADKQGKPTNKPIDAFNHGIDAIRYAIMGQKKTVTLI